MKRIKYSYLRHTEHLDNINQLAREDAAGFVADCEAQYRETLQDIAGYLADELEHYQVIMLSGPSASGKTTTSHILREMLESRGAKIQIISLDNFYLGRGMAPRLPNGALDYESVYALDIELMQKTLTQLMTTGYCDMPVFDFEQGRPSENTVPTCLGQDGLAIVEGIHALNPIVTDHLPQEGLLKMYISVKQGIRDEQDNHLLCARDIRLLRRTMRDYAFRNSSVENTFTMWEQVVRGELEYIKPFKQCADITINSVHMYEPCLVKQKAIQLLSNMEPGSRFYSEAQRLIGALLRFADIKQEMVPQNSLLREFIGGGIY